MEKPLTSIRPSDLLGLLAVVALGYVAPAFSRGLWNPDEPRAAHIGWSMAAPGGDRIVPRVNGEPFLQEPPLAHWLAGLSYRLSGALPEDAWAPRIPSMAASILAILAAGIAAGRIGGRAAGFFTALSLASTAEFLEIGNRAGTDILSTLFVALGGIQILGIAAEERLAARRAVLLGISTGLAFLSKNLLGPAFLSITLAAVLVRRRDLLRRPSNWARAALGLAALCGTALPWLALLHRADPSFLRTVLWEHTFGRMTLEGIHDPPFFKFAGRVLLDMLPWTPLFLVALRPRWRDAGSLALFAWIALPALLILVSGSKRDLYLLPIYPALAMALGLVLPGIIEKPGARIPAAILAAILALPVPALALLGGLWASPLPAAVFAGLAAQLYFLYRWIRERGWRYTARSAVTAGIFLGLAMVTGNLIRYRHEDPERSYAGFARALQELEARGFEVRGYRLGLKGASTTAQCLGRNFPNIADPEEAARSLSPEGPPAALVVEADRMGKIELPELRAAAARLDFPVRKGPFGVFLNRPAPGAGGPGERSG